MFKTCTIGKQMFVAAVNAAPLAQPYVTTRSAPPGRTWWSTGFSIIPLVFLWAFFSSALSAQIVNGSFETGTAGTAPPSPWVVTDYLNHGFTTLTPQTFGSLNLTSGGSALTIIESSSGGPGSQTDSDLGATATLRWPRYGNQSVIVNQHGSSYNVNALSQTFTITSANVDPADGKVHIRFVYAPVVENPGHSYNQQPYYFVQLKNITQNTVLYEEFGAGGTDAGIPWKTANSIQYKNWQLLDIAPGSSAVNLGDTVELDVIASGCSQGGHWGEVYVDGVGTTIPGITVEGTGPTQVKPGDNLTYTLNYRNGTTTAETGVVLQFTTPTDTTFQSLGSNSYSCTTPTVGTAGTVSCTIGNLAAGASGSLGITINVASGITAGTLMERNYSIASDQETLLVGTPINTKIWSATNTVTSDQSSVDFSTVSVAAGTGTSKTVTFTVPSGVTLGSVSAVTQGTANLDFKVLSGSGTTCTSGTTNTSCTVEVKFLPTAPGTRLGAIVLYDNNAPPNVLSTVYLTGTGQSSDIAFSPSPQITVSATGLSSPNGVAVDAAGDVFIADSGNNRVVEVTPSGIQTTVPATGLNSPSSVAVDGAGDVFIADSGNNQVVEVTSGGTQTKVSATGLSSPKGVALDAAGNVFIVDSGNNQVVEVMPGGTQTTLPVTGLSSPNGVAVDGVGDVFIADVSSSRAVEVQRSLPLSLTFAATDVGNTSTDSPQSVTIQNVGNQPLNAVAPGLSIGSNFVQVTGSGQPADCSSSFSLAPGADCNLSISFKPQSAGNIASTATFTDNNLGATSSTQVINLSGKGNSSSKATSGVSITSDSNPVLVQNTITLTATVSSTVGTPTGTVTFIDGTTPLGTGTVSTSGIAKLSISTLAVGSHSITAVYSGDTNFITATSSALPQVVQDFNLIISIAASSEGTAGVTSVTALPGGTAVYTFTLSPLGSTTFPATVMLSASGLPTGATYSFSPATLAAGTGSTQVTLTVNLQQVSAMNLPHTATPAEVAQNKPSLKLPFLTLGLLLLPFTRRMRRASRKLGRLLPLLLLFIAGLIALTGLSGCSNSSGYFGHAPATYTISVTGTSGVLTHSTSVTLIVQ